jgi:hypothetical protein
VSASAPILASRQIIEHHNVLTTQGTPGLGAAKPAAPTPAPPPTAQAWRFAALSEPADQVIVTLSNPNSSAVDVQVQGPGYLTRVRLPGAGGSEIDFTHRQGRKAFSVLASAPILPARLVFRAHMLRITYGTPEAAPEVPLSPRATSTPVLPRAHRAWRFTALPNKADQVLLTLSNQHSFPVDVRIELAGQVRQVRVPAAAGAEVELAPRRAALGIAVIASAPIVPSRLAIYRQATHISYGTPVPSRSSKRK